MPKTKYGPVVDVAKNTFASNLYRRYMYIVYKETEDFLKILSDVEEGRLPLAVAKEIIRKRNIISSRMALSFKERNNIWVTRMKRGNPRRHNRG